MHIYHCSPAVAGVYCYKQTDLLCLLQPWGNFNVQCSKNVLWWALRSLRVEELAVRAIHGMYSNSRSHVLVNGQYSEGFGERVGVHQSSVLSLVLLILVLEAFTWVPHWGGMKASLFGSTDAHCGHDGGVYLSKLRAWKALKVNDSMSTVSDLWCWPWRPQEESTSELSATVALATTPSSACDWWLTQITSASGVAARLGTSTSGQWLNRC